MEAEIADTQKEIDRQKEKAVAAVERLERTKKWLGIIDPSKSERIYMTIHNTTCH